LRLEIGAVVEAEAMDVVVVAFRIKVHGIMDKEGWAITRGTLTTTIKEVSRTIKADTAGIVEAAEEEEVKVGMGVVVGDVVGGAVEEVEDEVLIEVIEANGEC
jgi:hypothetical protein